MTFAAVVVLEKLVVYGGGVYGGGEEISSVLEGISEVLAASVEDAGVEEEASDEDGTELLGGSAVTVVGSAIEVTTVGETVTVGLSTDTIVDCGGAGAVETMVVGGACDAVDVTMAEKAGTLMVEVASRASRDATDVTVPIDVLCSGAGSPAIGSQASDWMGWPSCSMTLGLEFRYCTTTGGTEAELVMLDTGTSKAGLPVVSTPDNVVVCVKQAVATGVTSRCENVS